MTTTDSSILTLSTMMSNLDIHTQGRADSYGVAVVKNETCQLAPTLFWKVIKEALAAYPNTHEFQLLGVGNFRRPTIEMLSRHEVQVPGTNLQKYLDLLATLKVSLDDPGCAKLNKAHLAALTNRVEQVLDAIGVNEQDIFGRSPLYLAVACNHKEVAGELLRLGANPDATFSRCWSPLCFAAKKDQLEMVSVLSTNRTPPLITQQFTPFQSSLFELNTSISKTHGTIQEIFTILFALKHKRLKESSILFTKAITASGRPFEEMKTYYKEETRRRLVSHSWEVDWNQPPLISQMFFDTSNNLYKPILGGFQAYFLHKMAKGTRDFIRLYPNTKSSEHTTLSLLANTLQFASQQKLHNSKRILGLWQCGKPIILDITISNPGHAVTVLIWHHYILVCNRGLGNRKAVEVNRFQKRFLTTEIIDKITTNFATLQEFSDYFFTTLPSKLQYIQGTVEERLETECSRPEQITPTCSWESPNTCVHAFMILAPLLKNYLLIPQTFNQVVTADFIEKGKALHSNWLFDQQLTHLGKYCELLTNPSPRIFANHEILDSIAPSYHQKKQNPLLHPEIQKKMKDLEQKYPIITSSHHTL